MSKPLGAPIRAKRATFRAACSAQSPGATPQQVPLESMAAVASILQLRPAAAAAAADGDADGLPRFTLVDQHVGGRCAPLPCPFLLIPSAIFPAQRYLHDGAPSGG